MMSDLIMVQLVKNYLRLLENYFWLRFVNLVFLQTRD
jgi:hypothetical protein